ncbi:MAG: Flp pilus assembly complex ATPase component TadA [Actinomycetota bacterium]|nr:Flp pilus assembly complex ATPase component TadA [Actinomycetota bacterium]
MSAIDDFVERHHGLAELSVAERRLAIRHLVPAPPGDGGELIATIADALDGYGPLSDVMQDPSISDVLVNGAQDVWVEKGGVLTPTGIRFEEASLHRLVRRLAAEAGCRLDATSPVGDGRLADGSRFHAVLPPVTSEPVISIRRFPSKSLDVGDLIAAGTLTRHQADLLVAHVESHSTICISGRTGAGKTTLLNALLGCLPDHERVITIEETRELRPGCHHAVAMVTRQANVEGLGTIDAATLLRAALRMRPDRIVVGEVRGPEAMVALGAMSTGHEGSLITIHARSAADAVDRMVTLAMQDPLAPREAALRAQVTRAFEVLVHVDRTDGGERRVVEIVERC